MGRILSGLGLICLSLALLGSGCAPADLLERSSRFSVTSSTEGILPVPGPWKSLGRGVERNSFRFATTTGADMILYRFDPKEVIFSFDVATSVKRISEWHAKLERPLAVMNGVYFHEDDLPSGFFIHQGQRIGKRQFDLDKSGLIDLSTGSLQLFQLAPSSTRLSSVREAAQSYPFLIQQGKQMIKTDSGKAARRSFVGVDKEGRVYLGILPYAQLSLFELARHLMELPIAWNHVLNLDGGPSSGMAASVGSFQETIDSYVAIPNVILVRQK